MNDLNKRLLVKLAVLFQALVVMLFVVFIVVKKSGSEDSRVGQEASTLLSTAEDQVSPDLTFSTEAKLDESLAAKPTMSSEEMKQRAVASDTWIRLDEGFSLGYFTPPKIYKNGRDVRTSLHIDSPIVVLRVDPDQYAFRLLCESEIADGRPHNVEEWVEDFDLLAAINAGMFRQDFKTNTGFMKNYDHVNNPRMTPDYKAVFAFNPKGDDVPPAQIIDLQHQDFDALKNRYHTLVQGLRMVSASQVNVWKQSSRIWSTAALGVDSEGNVLLIHSRAPYSVHDFNDFLLSLPSLDVHNAMYLEGGPEASMYIQAGGRELKIVGSYETDFIENNENIEFWSLPNIIGVEKRKGNDGAQ